ncbi:MAG: diaminopimelate decarboxylase [Actinomycetota bacterium]|nr:diaminopimelate decarboxylase [Actinomycetota bacterium]
MDATALEPGLLPMTAVVGDDGRLSVGGVDLCGLADTEGTPLFVYDEAHLRARCREAVDAFGSGVAYASKAFLCVAMARLVHEEGMHLDVATGGELHVALAAGVPPTDLKLHGNNKSMAELARARELGVRLVVDSFDELDRLDRLHADDGITPQVLLRVTPGVEAHTHEYVMTGQVDSKFGFGLVNGDAALAVERARGSAATEVVGLHVHIGSQIFLADSFAKAVEVLAGFVVPLDLPELCMGGGLGVPYVEGEQAPSISEWASVLHDACRQAGIESEVTAEPGRSIAAAAGVTLYRVGTIKEIPGIRSYVSVDGGMSDNPRPVLYGSGYEAFLPRAAKAERPHVVTVVGKHCESGDIIARDARVPADLAVDDVLCTPVTGAYGYSMASNYNKVPRPGVVFVADGRARVVVRRESLDDLLRLDK